MCGYAYSFVSDFEVAKDIVQDAFITLWKSKDRYELSRPLLFRVVKHKSIDYLKSKQYRVNKYNTPLEILIDILTVNQKEDSNIEELTASITQSIDSLSTRCREVFLLSRKEKLKNKEIALKLNISSKTVEKHITGALSHIKEQLAKAQIFFITFIFLFF